MPSHTHERVQRLRVRDRLGGARMSGSVTISSSGVPARFRSMPVMPAKSSCSDLPASSSRWARVRLTVFSYASLPDFSLAGTWIVNVPPCTTGISYWLIW